MRTSSPLQSSDARRRRRRRLMWAAVACICIVLILMGRMFGGVISYVFSPLLVAKVWWNESHDPLAEYLRSRQSLLQERDMLMDRVRTLENERVYDAVRSAEHAATMSDSSDRIVAHVVVHPPSIPYDTILIDRGNDAGIRQGALVYSSGVAIGEVARVYPKSSFVVLFSAPEVESPVFIYGANVYARAFGEGGGVIRIAVPQGIQLSVGDPVIAPIAPTDIYGTIEHVEANPSDPDQYAYVSQKSALQSLRTLLVAREVPPVLTFEDAARIVAEHHAATTSSEHLIEALPLATTTAAQTGMEGAAE